MVQINLNEPFDLTNPYEHMSIVKVWSQDKEETINIYYNKTEIPTKIDKQHNFLRDKAMNHVDFKAKGAKVEETFSYVESGWNNEKYYA